MGPWGAYGERPEDGALPSLYLSHGAPMLFELDEDRSLQRLSQAREIAVQKLTAVGLGSKVADLFPAELSGGMQKRVGLARAIAANPEIIFFDEPTTGLHSADVKRLLGILSKLVEGGNSGVYVRVPENGNHHRDNAEFVQERLAMRCDNRQLGVGAHEQHVRPFVDGKLMTETASQALVRGTFADVPLIIGANSGEDSLMGLRLTPAQIAMVPPAARAVYAEEAVQGDEAVARAVFGDRVFVGAARWVAAKAADGAPAWLYHFSYVGSRFRPAVTRAFHAAEIAGSRTESPSAAPSWPGWRSRRRAGTPSGTGRP